MLWGKESLWLSWYYTIHEKHENPENFLSFLRTAYSLALQQGVIIHNINDSGVATWHFYAIRVFRGGY